MALPPKRRFKGADAPLDEKPEDVLWFALSDEELALCQNIATHGISYLRQVKRWNAEKIQHFLGRGEVKRELAALARQYDDREGIQERVQFFSQLKINAAVPAATNLLIRALRGEYEDQTGKIQKPPTEQQLDAAREILNRANVQGGKWAGKDGTPSIDARSIQIAIGSSPEAHNLDASGREAVRKILAGVTNRVRALASSEQRQKAVKDADVVSSSDNQDDD